MLSNITITCFAASYAVALVLELVRTSVRNAWLGIAAVGFLVAGLFAHSVHLWNLAQFELGPESGQRVIFSNWHDWCLLAAWVLALACLGLSLRKAPLIGIFMLPLVLVLIGLAYLQIDAPQFERTDAIHWWGIGHGVALLIGTVSVTIGFVAGAMFLLQAYRLKHKIPPSKTFKLPSLEWLLRLNEESLLISSFFLTLGLLAGIVLNVTQHAQEEVTVAWSEPTVWSSAVLLLWLVAALLFNWLYKPARRGRKVAYLTMASFGFLAIVLCLVLFSQHAAGGNAAKHEPLLDYTEVDAGVREGEAALPKLTIVTDVNYLAPLGLEPQFRILPQGNALDNYAKAPKALKGNAVNCICRTIVLYCSCAPLDAGARRDSEQLRTVALQYAPCRTVNGEHWKSPNQSPPQRCLKGRDRELRLRTLLSSVEASAETHDCRTIPCLQFGGSLTLPVGQIGLENGVAFKQWHALPVRFLGVAL